MQATIRYELSEGVISYEEKPRDQWLFDYPAQVTTLILFLITYLRTHACIYIFFIPPYKPVRIM